MTNKAQILEFYKKVKWRKFFVFGDSLGYVIWQQMQNFSTISPKLVELGQKTQDMGVNTTITVYTSERGRK